MSSGVYHGQKWRHSLKQLSCSWPSTWAFVLFNINYTDCPSKEQRLNQNYIIPVPFFFAITVYHTWVLWRISRTTLMSNFASEDCKASFAHSARPGLLYKAICACPTMPRHSSWPVACEWPSHDCTNSNPQLSHHCISVMKTHQISAIPQDLNCATDGSLATRFNFLHFEVWAQSWYFHLEKWWNKRCHLQLQML